MRSWVGRGGRNCSCRRASEEEVDGLWWTVTSIKSLIYRECLQNDVNGEGKMDDDKIVHRRIVIPFVPFGPPTAYSAYESS